MQAAIAVRARAYSALRAAGVSVAIAFAVGVLGGCGQTGPLYFDEDPPADQLPPSKKAQPANTVPQPTAEEKADSEKKKASE